jgi:hydroxyacylglutathione hydrolase
MDRGVDAGDIIKVGNTVELECLDTPGHTMSHICLLSHTDQPALFGHPNELYETFASQLEKLGDDTLLYPGHDYLINNLKFTLDREPDNDAAKNMLARYENQDPEDALVTTLAQEREMNAFFRLQSPTVIARLKESFPDMADDPDPKEVFVKLRELRNSW